MRADYSVESQSTRTNWGMFADTDSPIESVLRVSKSAFIRFKNTWSTDLVSGKVTKKGDLRRQHLHKNGRRGETNLVPGGQINVPGKTHSFPLKCVPLGQHFRSLDPVSLDGNMSLSVISFSTSAGIEPGATTLPSAIGA